MKYSNPILAGFHPDPSICRVGDDYYMITSSFEFFPGVPIYHSKDLVNWQLIGHCLDRKSQLLLDEAPASGGIWAPTLRYHEGVFYMTTTNHSDQGNFFVTATDPAGEWSDPIWVDQKGIDPSMFFDTDGKVYYTSTGRVNGKRGIVQSQIDPVTGERLTDIRFLWTGSGGQCPEGPHLYKMKGWYYLMIAEGGTEYGHMETIARSKSPWGPFESCPHNPILSHRNRKGHPIQGTGHADLVSDTKGNYWAVFLAFRYTRKYFHHLGRETFLAPVIFDEEGWLMINGTGLVELEMQVPEDEKHIEDPIMNPRLGTVHETFEDDALSGMWNYLRNPNLSDYHVDSHKKVLRLRGNAYTLSDCASPTFVGRRQQHMACEAATLMSFIDPGMHEEAGLTVYLNPEHHYDFFVSKEAEGYRLALRRVVGDMNFIQESVWLECDPSRHSIYLNITADAMEYKFYYGIAQKDSSVKPEQVSYLTQARTQFVSTEAGVLGFTGVYIGMYASGNGKNSVGAVEFDWFDYVGKDI